MDDHAEALVGDTFFSPSGKPNLRISTSNGEVILHSLPEPEGEILTYLSLVSETSQSVVIMTGFGLGHAPLALVRQRPNIRKFIFFEPNIGIFAQALRNVDLASLLRDPRVTINLGPSHIENIEQALEPAAKDLQFENAHLLRHLPSFTLDQIYHELDKKIYDYANLLNVNGATVLKQAKNFLTNRFQNFTILHHHSLLDELKDAFSQIPAVLVAAGPSLDKNIARLKSVQENALILSVDTALPALLAHGIRPHFVAAIDGDEVIYEKIADCAPAGRGISLLCQAHVTPKLAKTFPADRVFWGLGTNLVEKWFFQKTLNTELAPPDLGSWSVAHFNLAAALFMGASPIIMIGQDLAYSDHRDHASHTVLTDAQHMSSILSEKKDDLVWVDGWHGDKVPTSRGYYGVKLLFEQMMAAHPRVEFINATEGGARLEGAKHAALEEAVRLRCRESIKWALDKIGATRRPPIAGFIRHAEGMRDRLRLLRRKSEASLDAARDATFRFKQANRSKSRYKSYQDLPDRLKKTILKMERLNSQVEAENDIWVLLSELTLGGLKESERLKHEMNILPQEGPRYSEWLKKQLQLQKVIAATRLEALTLFDTLLEDFLRFHQEEERLRNDLDGASKDKRGKPLEKLAKFYFDHGYLTLAAPLVNELLAAEPDNARLLFYRGCVASEQRDHETGAESFQKALQLRPELTEEAEKFRISQGDAFLRHAEVYRVHDQGTFKKMLLKGLTFCPGHDGILSELRQCAQQELEKVNPASLREHRSLITEWHSRLEQYADLASQLDPGTVASSYHLYGCLMALSEDHAAARHWISRAIALYPASPEYHASMVSVLFDSGAFEDGFRHLKTAVALDRNYGRYWEEIGDSLFQAGQHDDALAAYEQGFLALPEKIQLIKKMGDCFMALGQLEAARAAYSKLHELQPINLHANGSDRTSDGP